MSALTKIFVVLLVVLSLILSAGLIVFVNRQENAKVAAADARAQLMAINGQINVLKAQLNAKEDAKQNAITDLSSQVTALKADVQKAQSDITSRDAEIARKDAELTQVNSSTASVAAALKVAQGSIKVEDDTIAAMRTSDDKLQKQVVEDSNRITELTNALDVTTHHDRFMAEQNTQLQQQLASANDTLRKYNISPTGANPPAGGAINTTPNVNINGVVRDTRNINGVPYATISLGAADSVTRGMQFKVIDPQNKQFLGYLTVDNVADHEASGHLDGPAVGQVRANVSEVRTQL